MPEGGGERGSQKGAKGNRVRRKQLLSRRKQRKGGTIKKEVKEL